MSSIVCPFCGSPDIVVDEDWIIQTCHNCGESEGYRVNVEKEYDNN